MGEPFLEQNVRYHCPIYCVLNFIKPVNPCFKRKIYLFDRGDYQTFSNDLMDTDWNSLKSNDIDTYAENITGRITFLTNKHIPNKIIIVRKTDPPWLTNNIKKLLRKKKACTINIKNPTTLIIGIFINALEIMSLVKYASQNRIKLTNYQKG